MHLQKLWAGTHQLRPSQSCICVSCSTEHVKIQIHLAEKFCSQLPAWQRFGWGGKGGREEGETIFQAMGKNSTELSSSMALTLLEPTERTSPKWLHAREPFTNKKSPAFISIMVAYAKLPLVKSRFLLHWLPPAVDRAGYLLKQAGDEWDFWINQHICWRENCVLLWSSKKNWLCFAKGANRYRISVLNSNWIQVLLAGEFQNRYISYWPCQWFYGSENVWQLIQAYTTPRMGNISWGNFSSP